jgi:hypothetical protein
MNGTQAIQTALKGTQQLVGMYLSDLSDADLLVRPAPAANHLAWQLGHLINSEVMLVKELLPDAPYPALPAGFGKQYGKEGAAADGPHGFLTKSQYLELFQQVRQATLTTVGKLSDADLDRANTGVLAQFAPTLGALLLLVSNHTLMHAGQFTVARRKLGKPVLF